jgi:hypothetical protein
VQESGWSTSSTNVTSATSILRSLYLPVGKTRVFRYYIAFGPGVRRLQKQWLQQTLNYRLVIVSHLSPILALLFYMLILQKQLLCGDEVLLATIGNR